MILMAHSSPVLLSSILPLCAPVVCTRSLSPCGLFQTLLDVVEDVGNAALTTNEAHARPAPPPPSPPPGYWFQVRDDLRNLTMYKVTRPQPPPASPRPQEDSSHP